MSDPEPGWRGHVWTAFVLLVLGGLAYQAYRTGHPLLAASVVGIVFFWIVVFATMPDLPDDFDHHHHH